jgi:hypothetical protein
MLDFQSLWDSHPSPIDNAPCKNEKGQPNFENQCAIRLGMALSKMHVNVSEVRRCWFKGHVGHTLAAEELAKWLVGQSRLVGTRLEYKDGKKAFSELKGQTGIIFCMNFWGTGNNGDHIDVWNGGRMKQGNADWMNSAQAVWFWKLS